MYYNLRTKLLKAIFAGNNLLNSVTNFHYFLAKYVRNSNNCLGKKESIFKKVDFLQIGMMLGNLSKVEIMVTVFLRQQWNFFFKNTVQNYYYSMFYVFTNQTLKMEDTNITENDNNNACLPKLIMNEYFSDHYHHSRPLIVCQRL